MTIATVRLDLCDIETDDLLCELEERGYHMIEEDEYFTAENFEKDFRKLFEIQKNDNESVFTKSLNKMFRDYLGENV